MIVDRTAWGRLRITGGDRVRFLQGLTTVDAANLADGAHGWGAMLNPKGRVLSVIDVAHAGDAFVIACEPSLTDKTRALFERYAVMDDVAFEPITGPAHQVWTDPASVWTAPFVEGMGGEAKAEIEMDAQIDAELEIERLRIRAGFLRYGADVDDDHFPFETPLSKLLDYGKGCYVGQEPVFRVYSQGNAARTLRGLVIAGSDPVALGAQIKHPTRDNAGAVTSAIAGPEMEEGRLRPTDGITGTTLALGYLHRTCWEVGGTVEIAGRAAVVHDLPW